MTGINGSIQTRVPFVLGIGLGRQDVAERFAGDGACGVVEPYFDAAITATYEESRRH